MEINGLEICKFRKLHDLTQSDLADMAGVDLRTIQNYESGKKIPKSKIALFHILFRDYKSKKETISQLYEDSDQSDLTVNESMPQYTIEDYNRSMAKDGDIIRQKLAIFIENLKKKKDLSLHEIFEMEKAMQALKEREK